MMWLLPTELKDLLDVLILSIVMYYLHSIMRQSSSKALFMGILTFFVMWVLIAQILEMPLMGMILDKFANIGILVLVIIFQEEIKKFLVVIGSARRWRKLQSFFRVSRVENDEADKFIAPLVLACMNMAKKKTGALIVVEQTMDISSWMYAGERFLASVNARMIEAIFFKNSPLHDGAMLISRGKIRAAGCILPVANNNDINKDQGLRHRAALGLSQKSDALVIVVSEERGTISIATHGEIKENINAEQLQDFLQKIKNN